jgi:drug/metabolite transporter (DMT)-like permease
METTTEKRQFLPSGYIYAILAAGFWAVSGTFSKSLFNTGMTPFQLVQLRTTIAAAALFLWLLARSPGSLRIRRSDLGYFFILGATLAVSQVTYLYAISKIRVAVAILMQYQAPVLIAAYAVFFARQRLSLSTAAAIATAAAGCYFVAGAYSHDILGMNSAGIISGLASAAAFAVYSVRSDNIMRTYRPLTVVFYAVVFAAIIWNILQAPFSAFVQGYGLTEWGKIIFVGVFGTIFPFGFYNKSIKSIGPARAVITSTMEPVFAGLISWLFLGEMLEGLQIFGAGLVIMAIIVLQLKKDPE